MWIEREQVLGYLPHREPFLFIEGVKKIDLLGKEWNGREVVKLPELVGSKVTACYRTDPAHPIFSGHFPGHPILPGVVQLEMMAQTGAFTLVPAFPDVVQKNREVALLSISRAKFRNPIFPEMDLTIEANCTRIRGIFLSHKSKILCEEKVMSEAEIMCSLKID